MIGFLDANIWGLLCIPVGVTFGFGPAVAVWLWIEFGNPSARSRRAKSRRKPTRGR